jgi:hypothetical protein
VWRDGLGFCRRDYGEQKVGKLISRHVPEDVIVRRERDRGQSLWNDCEEITGLLLRVRDERLVCGYGASNSVAQMLDPFNPIHLHKLYY